MTNELDRKIIDIFGGKVVRKDLVRKVKSGANVPVYVLEYLLGKYCATNDSVAIDAGLKIVNTTLAENFVRADEANKAQSMVKEKGRFTLIDKVRVRYLSEEDKYWAEFVNFGHKYVHIPESYIRTYDRLLVGGIWAQVTIKHEYDEEVKGKKSPFWIEDIKPIQLASFDFNEYRSLRANFTTEEWIDVLVSTIGMEPNQFSRRQKMLLLLRLIPLCEQNYNIVELGPRGTGKSYAFQELSPYAILLTGPTTVANLFYNLSTNKIGLVGLWDAIAFDEVADLQKMPKEVVTTLKTYCESGQFARGKEMLSGIASIAMFGNTNQPVDVMVKSSHLFLPMPESIREDLAFLDRIHYYIPGWEIPKMRVEFFTNQYGFIVDYFAEALRELRKHNFTELLDKNFSLGTHLNARDVKAVRKSVSGLAKLIYPHGEINKDELAEILELAIEGRRRVKEQLKKMGSYEYHQTSFSYIDNDTREERFVGVPEEGGRNLISSDPLAPGSIYAASVDDQGKVGLYRIEVGLSAGTGRIKLLGGIEGDMKESIQRAFAYISGKKAEQGIGMIIDSTDFNVQVIDLLGNKVPCECGVAFYIAVHSAIRKQTPMASMVCLGDITIQGNIKGVRSLTESLRIAMENGAKKALIPIENKRGFLEVPADIVEKVDPIFYGDVNTAMVKGLD